NPNGDYDVGAGPAGPQPTTTCADTFNGEAPGDCTPAAMAAYDIWEWRSALNPTTATGLPDGQGRLDLDNTTDPDSMVVTVSWTDKGQPRSYRLTVQQ
ncbi:MAG: hypothetical protein OES99_09535, partial [Gammaproteobacteria bacterium]|nr:hypothetical protein [Gammaproteobacteria bacterium]